PQQAIVSALDRLEVRRRDENQRLRVGHEPLTAAARSLQDIEQLTDTTEVLVRAALIPHAQREEREHVDVVVVEKDRYAARVGLPLAAIALDVVEHVDGNHLADDLLRLPVPVVQRVKPFLPRAVIELRNEDVEAVRTQVLAQARERAPERLRF